jgi:soluble lytic murein transglycosylase-like protein
MIHREILEAVNHWRQTVENEIRGRAELTTALVLAVIARESNGREDAQGSDQDFGLMQITRPAWQDYQAATNDPETVIFPDSMLVPNLNIRVGGWFLNEKIDEMGNTFDGLRAFNAGTARATRDPLISAGYAEWVTAHIAAFGAPVA